jgi:hypothetical protein
MTGARCTSTAAGGGVARSVAGARDRRNARVSGLIAAVGDLRLTARRIAAGRDVPPTAACCARAMQPRSSRFASNCAADRGLGVCTLTALTDVSIPSTRSSISRDRSGRGATIAASGPASITIRTSSCATRTFDDAEILSRTVTSTTRRSTARSRSRARPDQLRGGPDVTAARLGAGAERRHLGARRQGRSAPTP